MADPPSLDGHLRRFGIEPNPYDQEIYNRAHKAGRTYGSPSHDLDDTIARWSEPIRLGQLIRRHVPGGLDYLLTEAHIPLLRVRPDAASFPIHTHFYLGAQAYLLGLAEGSGKSVVLYTLGYDHRVAAIAYESPAFAKAFLGIEPEEPLPRDPREAIQHLEGIVRQAPNIFTFQDQIRAIQNAFDQYRRDPTRMTADDFAVTKQETLTPGYDTNKGAPYARLGGKPLVAEAMEQIGHIDDKARAVEMVAGPAMRGKGMHLHLPPGARNLTTATSGAEIQMELAGQTGVNQCRLLTDAVATMAASPRGQGEASVVRLAEPQGLPETAPNDGDYIPLETPSVKFHTQKTEPQFITARRIMIDAHLNGPPPETVGQRAKQVGLRGSFSALEIGGAVFLSKTLVGEKVDWGETIPEVLIFTLFGLAGGLCSSLFGKSPYLRGVIQNIFTPWCSMSVVQWYHDREWTPFSNLIVGTLFSGFHLALGRFLIEPLIIQKMGYRALCAFEAGNIAQGIRWQRGLRGLTYLTRFTATTALLTGMEWFGRRSRLGAYSQTKSDLVEWVSKDYLEYRQMYEAIEDRLEAGEEVSDEQQKMLQDRYKTFARKIEDRSLTMELVAGDHPDIEGKHYMEALRKHQEALDELEEARKEFEKSRRRYPNFPVGPSDLVEHLFRKNPRFVPLEQKVEQFERSLKIAEAALLKRRQTEESKHQKDWQREANRTARLLQDPLNSSLGWYQLQQAGGTQVAYILKDLLAREQIEKDRLLTRARGF
ncbi:MAG: hypothetical protein HYT77_02540 [Deltaproteobacteria bacterium]|nr:hypothetical protein [Deltaproteobacteria bacterium]